MCCANAGPESARYSFHAEHFSVSEGFCLNLCPLLCLPSTPGSSYSSPAAPGTRPAKGQAASAFDRFKDAADVEQSLRDSCLVCVQHILTHVRSELSSATPRPHLSTVLFLARLCQSMGDLCSHLRQCVLGREGGPEAPRETARPGRKLGKAKAPAQVGPAQARWAGLKQDLEACSMEAYHIWSSALSKVGLRHKHFYTFTHVV